MLYLYLLFSLFIFSLLFIIYNKKIKIKKLDNKLISNDLFILTNKFCKCNKFFTCNLCKSERTINFELEQDINYLFNSIHSDVGFIIDTDGGKCSHLDFLAYCLRKNDICFNVYVPIKAASAGSFISLAGNNIYMNWYSYLGPIDSQIYLNVDESESFPARYISELTDKNDCSVKIRALEAKQFHEGDIRMITKMYPSKTSRIIINNFLEADVSHDYKYDYHDLNEFGFNINTPVPYNIQSIFNLYREIKE
jgi:hypothetical protein